MAAGESKALGARCFRTTDRGRAFVALAKADREAVPLSRYLLDVLLLCGTGAWFRQLQQFVPPRPLANSLVSLIELGLVEAVAKPPEQPPDGRGRPSGFAPLSPG